MATAYPGAVDSLTTRTDNVDIIYASHVNDLQGAVTALETKLGTGSSTALSGYVLYGTGSGVTAFTQLSTLVVTSAVAGTGIGVSGATGAVTITNNGVTSITGTANQVVASGSTGAITLSLPQSIGTTSTPQFGRLGLGIAADGSYRLTIGAASSTTVGEGLSFGGDAGATLYRLSSGIIGCNGVIASFAYSPRGTFRSGDGGANYFEFGRDSTTTGNFVITANGSNTSIFSLTTAGAIIAPNYGAGIAEFSSVGLVSSTAITGTGSVMKGTSPRLTTSLLDANGNEIFNVTATASAVNELTIANGATGVNASITASGETNTGITITGKGTKGVTIGNVLDETVVVVTDGAGAVINTSLGNIFTWTAAADRTAGTTTNPVAGRKIVIEFTASGGARTLTLPTATTGDFRYGSDITVLSATASGKTDYIGCIYNGAASRWDVVAVTKGF